RCGGVLAATADWRRGIPAGAGCARARLAHCLRPCSMYAALAIVRARRDVAPPAAGAQRDMDCLAAPACGDGLARHLARVPPATDRTPALAARAGYRQGAEVCTRAAARGVGPGTGIACLYAAPQPLAGDHDGIDRCSAVPDL